MLFQLLRNMQIIEIRNIENISTNHPPKCMTLKKNEKKMFVQNKFPEHWKVFAKYKQEGNFLKVTRGCKGKTFSKI